MGISQIHLLFLKNKIHHMCCDLIFVQGSFDCNDLTLMPGIHGRHLKYAMPYSGHLRTMVGANDPGHDVAAKSRASLEQETSLRVNIETGTISGQAGIKSSGY